MQRLERIARRGAGVADRAGLESVPTTSCPPPCQYRTPFPFSNLRRSARCRFCRRNRRKRGLVGLKGVRKGVTIFGSRSFRNGPGQFAIWTWPYRRGLHQVALVPSVQFDRRALFVDRHHALPGSIEETTGRCPEPVVQAGRGRRPISWKVYRGRLRLQAASREGEPGDLVAVALVAPAKSGQ